ncbi:hypothetical protein [Pseudoalteromonas sp. PA2MD11]|uniref:hypothetical protein n=1 Tax=Pseudoalteromonas sp. PA2MD11 TaxID=2785057 RepID=UPI001ADF5CF5|nr:hypothetical protein [Pseudoalteromonas sp. PA2MD11]
MQNAQYTLLTAKELSEHIKFKPDYINRKLKDNVFFEGQHYIQPFGSRKVFYLLENVLKEMYKASSPQEQKIVIPLTRGGMCNG